MIDNILHDDIIQIMDEIKEELNTQCIGTEILLLSLLSIKDSMTYLIFKELNITKEDVATKIKELCFLRKSKKYTSVLIKILENAKKLEEEQEFVYDEAYLWSLLSNGNNVAVDIINSFKIEGNEILNELTNALDYLSQDSKMLINLTKLSKEKKLNHFIGRQDYLQRIDRILSKKQKNNCMLLGLAGVGKSGLVEGLAEYYTKIKPSTTIYQLDLGTVMAGTRYRGDLEEKVISVLDEIKEKDAILFIDEVHNILTSSYSENSLDIANILKPYLARSQIKCIGATTTEEYYKFINKDKALMRRFQNIYVDEPKQDECFKILKGIKGEYETFHNVYYPDDLLKFIISSSRYLLNRHHPDKDIDLLDESGLIAKEGKVDKEHIKELIFQQLGIERKKIFKKLKKIKDLQFKTAIINYLNLENQKYIYCSETNECLQQLKEIKNLFGLNNEYVLEIDLNDYNSEHHISTLLGTSPGYVGYEEGGILSNHIIRHNMSVVIIKNYNQGNTTLDKIIKKIINEGKITDMKGQKIDFLNSIILFSKENIQKIGF